MSTYENITIEKGMYKPGGYGLTAVLESLDPSENYIGTPLEGLDAFQRQLKRFDIKVSGADSDRVEKFFSTSSSAALFPEYIGRAVRQGIQQRDVINDIVAVRTHIDGMDYRSIASVPTDSDLELREVTEGTAIPETNIAVQSTLVNLKKRGRMLTSSYEALRFQRLDVFTVMLRQIGAYIAKMHLNDAIDVIVNGDGDLQNPNAAPSISVAQTNTMQYEDLVTLWGELAPYELNTIISPTTQIKQMMNMTEMKDSFGGNKFHATGEMITPLGAKLIHATSMTAGSIIGLDKNYALEMVIAGDVCTEYDKLIDRQLERATISCIAGFSKLFTGAGVVLNITAS
ncbi:MAG: phage major capsid protein [Clostridia bacterium]|nr:phage major capsid protein [Clostridia bacterium]